MANDVTGNGMAHEAPGRPEADPHGLAAMLLVESLIHMLIERSVISLPNAVEVVDAALQVNLEMSADQGDASSSLNDSRQLIGRILASLRIDLRDARD